MLTRLKLTRGEGQIVEPSSHPSRRKHIPSPQVSRSHSPSMAHEESHEHVLAKDEDLRKAIMEMREMMKILIERNTRLQGEGSNPSKNKGDSGDKTPTEMEGMVLLHHPLLHLLLLLLLLLLLPVQELFQILQKDMVKLLIKFLH
jgi:hypothetical protein